jgi:hypothetical protein
MKIKYLYVLVAGMLAFSCREERDLSYTGPTVVEFNNPATNVLSVLTGQSIGGASEKAGNTEVPIRGNQDSVLIQLVGPQQAQPMEVHYEVVAEKTTAVEGTHYSFLETKGTAILPAHASRTAIRLRLSDPAANATGRKTLTLRITGTNKTDVGVSPNYQDYTLTIFPAQAYLTKTIPAGGAFSSRNGQVYTGAAVAANIGLVDIAFTTTGTDDKPSLVSPFTFFGVGAAVTRFTPRYGTSSYMPAASTPAALVPSWVTVSLRVVTDVTLNGINYPPASSTYNPLSVPVVEHAVHGFVNAAGKKGLIRVKSIVPGANGAITVDVITQP